MSEEHEGEKCVRCGEVGEDRRTLWMACFYKMDELDVPFEQVQITGRAALKIGEKSETVSWSSQPWVTPVFEEPGEEPHDYRFYTLRVCKDCRASWMGAIENWFKADSEERKSPGSGIFVRRNGAIVEVSEEEWAIMHPDREPVRALRPE